MKVAIAGFGIEGESAYAYYTSKGDEVTILDEQLSMFDLPFGVDCVLGEHAFGDVSPYDLVIRTPSISPERLKDAKKIWSVTNEFFAQISTPIIGVTGTKGKSTTVSLIQAMLHRSGKKSILVGNIGTPSLDKLKEALEADVVVYELSSFQLWDIRKSPHIAVVLMVEPDHLNIHGLFSDYVNAKANIVRYQTADDIVIYHPSNAMSQQIADMSPAHTKMRYMCESAAYIKDDEIRIDGETICKVSDVGMPGEYNLQSICAAVSACWQITKDTQAIGNAICDFKGLPHHLEKIATKRGVDYYDDSYAAAPTATIGAIGALAQPIVLIVGGVDRGLELDPLVSAIVNKGEGIRRVLVIGEIRDRLIGALADNGYTNTVGLDTKDMKEIVRHASELAQVGDAVLLSPGCPSFDMFRNFVERGDKFKEAIGVVRE